MCAEGEGRCGGDIQYHVVKAGITVAEVCRGVARAIVDCGIHLELEVVGGDCRQFVAEEIICVALRHSSVGEVGRLEAGCGGGRGGVKTWRWGWWRKENRLERHD